MWLSRLVKIRHAPVGEGSGPNAIDGFDDSVGIGWSAAAWSSSSVLRAREASSGAAIRLKERAHALTKRGVLGPSRTPSIAPNLLSPSHPRCQSAIQDDQYVSDEHHTMAPTPSMRALTRRGDQ